MVCPIETVQVFILAENRLLREALTRILSKKNDIQVVGACAFAPDVVEQVCSAAPDVLLCDDHYHQFMSKELVVGWCDEESCRTYGAVGALSACGKPFAVLKR